MTQEQWKRWDVVRSGDALALVVLAVLAFTGSAAAEPPDSDAGCIDVNLSDYNLFLLEDYNGGHDVQGKVAAGGSVTMTDFAVGTGLPDSDISNALVAGGDLTLSRGGVWGDARYGGHYSTNTSVVFPRGSAAQGAPIDFAVRGAQLRQLSSQLANLTVNGSTRREPWGGLFLRGSDPSVNVLNLDASAITGAKLLSIEAPAGSLAVVNIRGASATFTGFGIMFSGGIDQHGVLFNFVDATSIEAHGFGFWGTVLAPLAHVSFNNGSWDGGIYAKSLTGNAEGHINPLTPRSICVLECIRVRLSDYNLMLEGDYSGGHDVQGKVAAGGHIAMTDFSVGMLVPDNDTANTLVAGGSLTLSRGGVGGDAWYGGTYSADSGVTFSRGSPAQGTPIDFAARFTELRQLSSRLDGLPANGTARRENWGGVFLRGTSPGVNTVDVDASILTGAALLSIEAPAGSLTVVNIHGASATLTGFATTFSGGTDQHGVLYNFVDATRIDSHTFGIWGTVLAPYADLMFSNGSWDGGIYAKSLTGSAEGHINALIDRDICQ